MSIKRRLSQTLGQIKKGFAVDTYEGGFPISYVTPSVLAADLNAVHAAVVLGDAVVEVTRGITDPDVPRCIVLTGNQASVEGDAVVYGTDWADRCITELVALDGVSSAETWQAFKTVTQIDLPPYAVLGDRVEVGFSDYLGLPRPIYQNDTDSVVLVEVGTDGAAAPLIVDPGYSVDQAHSTVMPASVVDTDIYRITYYVDTF